MVLLFYCYLYEVFGRQNISYLLKHYCSAGVAVSSSLMAAVME